MKFLIVLAFFVAVAAAAVNLTDEQKAKAKQFSAECMEKEKVSAEEVAKFFASNFDGASTNLKCFANCFLEKAGLIVDGKFQDTFALQKFGDTEEVKKVLAKCTPIKGENDCDTAFKMFQCFQENNVKVTA